MKHPMTTGAHQAKTTPLDNLILSRSNLITGAV